MELKLFFSKLLKLKENMEKGSQQSVQKTTPVNEHLVQQQISRRPHVTVVKREPQNAQIAIYVGIDFGTSFTKVFFKSETGQNIAIEWTDVLNKRNETSNEIYFLPSTLYYDKKTHKLHFFQETDCKLLYFKYGMIKPELQNKIFEEKINEEAFGAEQNELAASVYYVANVIKLSKEYIATKMNTTLDRLNIRFNMGCPIDNWKNEHINLYAYVLKMGCLLQESGFTEGMLLQTILEFCKKNKDSKSKSRLQVIPELYAEAYNFINDNTTNDGLYTILDIGGGTVDFAVIQIKHVEKVKKVKFLSQNVLPLGIEILLNRFYPEDNQNNRIELKERLKNEKPLLRDVQHGTWEKIENIRERVPYEFRSGFNEKIFDAKNKDKILMTRHYNSKQALPLYIYGGGANYEWYSSIIQQHNSTLNQASIPCLLRKNPNAYRLLIAENLANIRDYVEKGPDAQVDFGLAFVNATTQKGNGDISISDYGIIDDR